MVKYAIFLAVFNVTTFMRLPEETPHQYFTTVQNRFHPTETGSNPITGDDVTVFSDIGNIDDIWEYLNYTFIPELYAQRSTGINPTLPGMPSLLVSRDYF